jgi:hypothetical protein
MREASGAADVQEQIDGVAEAAGRDGGGTPQQTERPMSIAVRASAGARR